MKRNNRLDFGEDPCTLKSYNLPVKLCRNKPTAFLGSYPRRTVAR